MSVPKDAGQQAVPCMANSAQPSPLEVPDSVRGSWCPPHTSEWWEGKDVSAAEAIEQ